MGKPYSEDPRHNVVHAIEAGKAAARSIDSLWEIIGSCLTDFSPSECAAYLANAGYGRRDGQPYRKML